MGNNMFDKSIFFEVSTYENLRNKGNELIELINIILEDFLFPLDIPLEIEIEKMNTRNKYFLVNKKNLDKVYKMLKDGEIQYFGLREYYGEYDSTREEFINYQGKSGGEAFPPAFGIGFVCEYIQEVMHFLDMSKNPRIANIFSFSMCERLFNNRIESDMQEKFIELFKLAFTKINGVTGFITYETICARSPQPTPYEDGIDARYIIASQSYNQYLRGYFWGNILTEEHLEKLGGIEKVQKDAPCAKVEKFKHYSGKALFLQLTNDINHYSDDNLKLLKNYLIPVLPKGEKKVLLDPFNAEKDRYKNGFVTRLLEEDFPIIKIEF